MITWVMMIVTIWRLAKMLKEARTPTRSISNQEEEMDDRQCMCLRGRWGRRCMIRAMQRQQLCRACRLGGLVCQCGCFNCDDADDEAVAPHTRHAQGAAITPAPTTPITAHLAAVPGVTRVYRSRLAGEVQHLLRTKMMVAVMTYFECMKQTLGAGNGERHNSV